MKNIALVLFLSLLAVGQIYSQNRNSVNTKNMKGAEDKEHYTFPLSDKVTRQSVTFKNRFGIILSGDLYLPKARGTQPLAALAISGPFGAVKEQSSGLYANQMAERGFIALAFLIGNQTQQRERRLPGMVYPMPPKCNVFLMIYSIKINPVCQGSLN